MMIVMTMIIVMIMMIIMTMKRIHRGAARLLGVPEPQSERVTLAGDGPRGRADGEGEQSNADIASNYRVHDYRVTTE